MKKLLAKAGICTLTAGLLLSGATMIYATDDAAQGCEKAAVVAEHDFDWEIGAEAETVFWKKKDKTAEPKEVSPEAEPKQKKGAPRDTQRETPNDSQQESQKQPPEANPNATPSANPGANPTPVPAPTPVTPATPRDNAPPQIKDKPADGTKSNETSDASFVYNSTQNRMNQPQNQQNQPQNQQNQQPIQQNQQNRYQNQQNQQNQQAQPIQQNTQNRQGVQQQGLPQSRHACTNFASGISCEINKILANQPAIKLDPNAYMLQHEDGLWLVMGNIRAKVEILIYVDQKHMENSEFEGGNAVPLYK